MFCDGVPQGWPDHTIDKPAEYAFWRDYVPNLRPAWPENCSTGMSPSDHAEARALGFNPERLPTPVA